MKTKTLTVDDAGANALLSNPTIVAWLPCLKQASDKLSQLANGKAGCPLCENKIKTSRATATIQAKNCLSTASPETLQKIKEYLNTEKLHIVFTTLGGTKQTKVV